MALHTIRRNISLHLTKWQTGVGLILFFSLSSPLWAPMSQGWCKNNTVLTPATNLTFGTFASYSGGTVTVSVEGLRSTDGSGGVVLMGGTVTQAVYTIRGCANDTYSIVTPADTVLTDGVGNSMPMINFVSFPVGSGILDANGDGTLQFGATLTVANPQPSGNYSGTYLVEIVLQ